MPTTHNKLLQRFFTFTNQPAFLPILSGLFVIWFLIWVYLTFVPIMIVEAKYLTFKIANSLGIQDIQSLMLPNTKALNPLATSKYQQYGIRIPALNLDEPVVFNVDPNDEKIYNAALRQGIAHASGTAFPNSGRLGYYFAHSSNPSLHRQFNAIFYLLGKLKTGDEVFIWHEGERYDYLVTQTRTTEPTDISFLDHEYPSETIVLQTCWPPGTTSERLLVFAERQQ